MVKEYLKRHIGVMFGMVVLFLFQTCFLFVKQVTFNDLVYFLVLEFMVLSVIIAVDVIRYRNRVNRLADYDYEEEGNRKYIEEIE